MYDFNDLEYMLRSGATADQIAAAFTKNLNDAIDAVKKPDALQEACCALAEAWHDVLDTYAEEYESTPNKDWYITGDDVYQVLPTVMQALFATQRYADELRNIATPVQKNTAGPTAVATDFDKLVNDFLKMH
jgi:hypothetical protein